MIILEASRKPRYKRALYKMYVVDNDLKLYGTFLTHVLESPEYKKIKDTMMGVEALNEFTMCDVPQAIRDCVHTYTNDIRLFCITSENPSEDFITIKNRILKEMQDAEK